MVEAAGMLSSSRLVAFAATADAVRARAFYSGVLGLTVKEETQFALVLDSHGVELRLQKVSKVEPPPYTALGWQVAGLELVARVLGTLGIEPARYDFLDQDALGIWTAPGGSRVLWIKDPDGNLLSLHEQEKDGV